MALISCPISLTFFCMAGASWELIFVDLIFVYELFYEEKQLKFETLNKGMVENQDFGLLGRNTF